MSDSSLTLIVTLKPSTFLADYNKFSESFFQPENLKRFVFVTEAAAAPGCMATGHWTPDGETVLKLVFAECNS